VVKNIKVIGLNGSPNRNGNTATLIKWVLDGCHEAGAEVEMLNVSDYDIKYCLGCNSCLREGACIITDDYQAVYNKIIEADGIVVGSPVYADAPTAILKTLMDRMTLLNLYAATFQKKFSIGVATSGLAPTKGVAKGIAEMFGQRCGAIGATTATLENGPQPLEQNHRPDLPARANKLGKRFVNRISANKPVFSLKSLWINILRKYLLSKMVTRFPKFFGGAININPGLYGESEPIGTYWERLIRFLDSLASPPP